MLTHALSGTSMACPFIVGGNHSLNACQSTNKQEAETGLNDCKTVDEIITGHLLRYTSDDRGKMGKDKNWGHGVVDV